MGRVLLAAFAGLLTLSVPSVAGAAEATRAEALRLAHDATFDNDALRKLRQIDEIDGRAANLDEVLEGAEGTEIERRVETLLQTDVSAPVARDPSAERVEAERILSQDRYQQDEIPRPFRGPLEWMADRLEPVADAIEGAFEWVGDRFRSVANGTPGGAATLWALIGLAVLAVVVVQTTKAVERRGRTGPEHGPYVMDGERGDDPKELERRAAAARANGDHELAVRLLFRAGLLRLARARAIPARRSLTTGEIRRLLSSPEFDRIGLSFDEIAYGRRTATAADSEQARAGWSEVMNRVAG